MTKGPNVSAAWKVAGKAKVCGINAAAAATDVEDGHASSSDDDAGVMFGERRQRIVSDDDDGTVHSDGQSDCDNTDVADSGDYADDEEEDQVLKTYLG